jgi:hypothetical protein
MINLNPPVWGKADFTAKNSDGNSFSITATGRVRWALENLIVAGSKGCTPIDNPGPRWSGYVYDLRALGVLIETVTEAHDGPFKGTHARYVLQSTVSLVAELEVAA